MCGIAVVLTPEKGDSPSEANLRRMLGSIRHRGPDEFGIYLDDYVGLGNARLSIIDISSGQQPISNEDDSLWIVFNGEIFNYVELRPELEARGHRFKTASDTEVLLHLFEEYGPECIKRLNGQFVFAIWNSHDKSLFIARDRLGVRPLFYTIVDGTLIAGSEIKVLLTHPRVQARIDTNVLGQIFKYWSPLSPNTIFQNIFELPPGHFLQAKSEGAFKISPYWRPDFPLAANSRAGVAKPTEEHLEEFEALLIDAAKIRLRADVAVGAYLSGGLDSSIIASIIRNFTTNHLDTFSIAFDDVDFDESAWQRRMAGFLGTQHQVVNATHADIGRVFPDVIWHAEVPVLRTAPAPMFLLSKLVRDSGFKVVLTGEGADEFLGGYDIFKEAKVRRFWARQPNSTWRSLLLKKLYEDIPGLSASNHSFLTAFFRENLENVKSPDYSHSIRWRNTARNRRFFSEAVRQQLARSDTDQLKQQLPAQFDHWHPLARAQYLEIKIFLSQYLLCSQGDRMGMAHSVEGRFPFLDCRLVEFCNALPANLKLRGLTEKYLLKQLGKKWLPKEIWQRPKRPYRAPIRRSFFNDTASGYVDELLSPEEIRKTDLFNLMAVDQLVKKAKTGARMGETDDMALVGIISTQLVYHRFVEKFRSGKPLDQNDRVKVCTGSRTPRQ